MRIERVRDRTQDFFVQRFCGACGEGDFAVHEFWLLAVLRKAVPHDGLHVVMQQACAQKLADHIAKPACGVEMVHVGQPVWIDFGHQRHGFGQIREVFEVDDHACGPRHGGQVQHQIGRAAGGHQANEAVHKCLFRQDFGGGPEGLAKGGIAKHLLGAARGQRVAHPAVGVHKRRAGQVHPHEFHQHLVGIGGAIKRAGARAMIRGHLGGHQFFATYVACGE